MADNQYTFENEQYRKTYWHTCSHILAQAVKHLYPDVKLAIGPAIDNGFYYDIDSPTAFTPEILTQIEAEMRKICKEKLKLERFELPRAEALELMKDEPYKVELINDLPEDAVISFYKQGDFTDLCAGPHLDSTGRVKGNAIKLTACNSAYWRGDSNRQVLQRIYGIAFPKKDELDAYLKQIEEAKKRDHRRLGKELGLFTLMEEGPGFPFFLPKGMVLRNTLLDYWRKVHKKYGYQEISTPIILNKELWHRSGHWEHYKDNMYTTIIDGEDYAIKPMNCPGGMLVYKTEPHSYRDLPLRMAELGLVHRHELSGALHGLFRVRCFTQDDAHIFMTWDQMEEEIQNVVRLFDEVYSVFGLTYQIEVSTMPEDHIGDEKTWDFATETLKKAISDMGKDFVINEGDGAFYGPKLDFHLADSLGRTWQCGTIQLDMQMPERFELEYTGAGWREASPRHDPPCGAGLHRTVHRRHHRAFRRRFPRMADSRSGQGTARHRPCCCIRRRRGKGPGRGWLPSGSGSQKREAGLQDPRSTDHEDPLHGGRRRQGHGEPHRFHPPSHRRRSGRYEPGRLHCAAEGGSGHHGHQVNTAHKKNCLGTFRGSFFTSNRCPPQRCPRHPLGCSRRSICRSAPVSWCSSWER